MDVSAEAADLVVKEGLQATETAVKLAGSGIKNVAALLLALSKQDYKVIGQASAARLARDPNPPAVVQIRAEDLSRFRKMAAKQYGVLYLPVRKRGDDSGLMPRTRARRFALYSAIRVCLVSAFPRKLPTAISAMRMETCMWTRKPRRMSG
mgnify:CR=1 FL=1